MKGSKTYTPEELNKEIKRRQELAAQQEEEAEQEEQEDEDVPPEPPPKPVRRLRAAKPATVRAKPTRPVMHISPVMSTRTVMPLKPTVRRDFIPTDPEPSVTFDDVPEIEPDPLEQEPLEQEPPELVDDNFDTLKIVLNHLWLNTTIGYGVLVIVGVVLFLLIMEILLYKIVAILVYFLFMLIAYWRMYRKISPGHVLR